MYILFYMHLIALVENGTSEFTVILYFLIIFKSTTEFGAVLDLKFINWKNRIEKAGKLLVMFLACVNSVEVVGRG